MKLKTTLILLGLVLGLGLFFLVYVMQQPTAAELAEARGRVFQPHEFDDRSFAEPLGLKDRVTRIQISRGKEILSLSHTESPNPGWRILAPIEARADDGMVAALLAELEFLKAARKLDEKAGLSEFGLAEPAATVTFGYKDEEWTLLLGDKTQDGQSIYVARKDELSSVYVVPAAIYELAAMTANDYRDKAALRFNPQSLLRLTYLQAEKRFTWSCTGWVITHCEASRKITIKGFSV